MVSIRPAAVSGARRLERSTVGFAKTSDGFVVDNMSGFANARVDPQMVAIARDCVQQLNLQLIRDDSQRCLEDAMGGLKEMDVADAMNDGAEGQRLIGLQVRAVRDSGTPARHQEPNQNAGLPTGESKSQ